MKTVPAWKWVSAYSPGSVLTWSFTYSKAGTDTSAMPESVKEGGGSGSELAAGFSGRSLFVLSQSLRQLDLNSKFAGTQARGEGCEGHSSLDRSEATVGKVAIPSGQL